MYVVLRHSSSILIAKFTLVEMSIYLTYTFYALDFVDLIEIVKFVIINIKQICCILVEIIYKKLVMKKNNLPSDKETLKVLFFGKDIKEATSYITAFF